jgi:hypothetical protein
MHITFLLGESVVTLPGVVSFTMARGLSSRPKA